MTNYSLEKKHDLYRDIFVEVSRLALSSNEYTSLLSRFNKKAINRIIGNYEEVGALAAQYFIDKYCQNDIDAETTEERIRESILAALFSLYHGK